MKKLYIAFTIVFAVIALAVIEPVRAQNNETGTPSMDGSYAHVQETTAKVAIPQAQIFTPTYPVGIDGGQSKLVEYSVLEAGDISGHITSRTLQFFTQYDVPLSEPMGPYRTDIPVTALQTTSWNELVYLPTSVVEKARAMKEYAIVLKTSFTGRTSANTEFASDARLLLLLPPAPFGKSTPANGAIVPPNSVNLKWGSSVGATEYQYCIDRIDNNSCDTDWAGTYWLGTYDTDTFLNNLPPDEAYYWQVRAVNSAGVTYANNGRFWKFTTQPAPPYLFYPIEGMRTDSRRPDFHWSSYYSALGYNFQISRTFNFSQIILNTTTNSTYYTPLVDLPAKTTLYWRVRFRNASGFTTWSNVESFVTPNPPSIPILESPARNMLVRTYEPTLNWKDSLNPLGSPAFWLYEIQIAEDEKFWNVVQNEATTEGDITDSNFTPTISLLPNRKYYWRVRAFNQDGHYSSWSVTQFFRSAMLPPILTSPSDTEPLYDKRPSLDWEDTDGATGYKLVIAKDPDLSYVVKSVTTVGSHYALTSDLPANMQLYWRVLATGPNGPSLWSDTWSFFTANPPSVPVLASPSSNRFLQIYTPYFDWSNSRVPEDTWFMAYHIQVDNDRDFSSPAIDTFTGFNTVSDSHYLAEFDLDSNTLFYWRVRAYNMDMQYSAWSGVWSFRTALLPPADLNITIHSDNPRQPVFDWMAVDGASGYRIQVSTSPTFGTLLVNATTSNNVFWPVVNLPTNRILYWRVRALGANGPSGWGQSEFEIP